MQTILPPSGNTIKILGKPKPAEHGLRWMTYVLAQPVEGGVLVFHTLTRALLLLTPEEWCKAYAPTVYKYPALLPFFWVWRLIYKGITNRKKVTQEIKTIKAGKQN